MSARQKQSGRELLANIAELSASLPKDVVDNVYKSVVKEMLGDSPLLKKVGLVRGKATSASNPEQASSKK